MKAADTIALIITISVCSFLLLAFLNTMITGNTMSETAQDAVDNIITSLIAIISLYIGTKIRGDNNTSKN